MKIFLIILSVILFLAFFKSDGENSRLKQENEWFKNRNNELKKENEKLYDSLIKAEKETEKAEYRASGLATEIDTLQRALDVKSQLLKQLEKKVKP